MSLYTAIYRSNTNFEPSWLQVLEHAGGIIFLPDGPHFWQACAVTIKGERVFTHPRVIDVDKGVIQTRCFRILVKLAQYILSELSNCCVVEFIHPLYN